MMEERIEESSSLELHGAFPPPQPMPHVPLDRSELRLPPPPSNARVTVIWYLRQWARDLMISLAASVLIITCLYQPVRVEGTSMQPRLHDQDRLFINKFVYRFEKVSRGDVIVFHYPRDPEKSYIKRVIALPGDDVRIADGDVFINGQRLDEPYVPRRFRDARSLTDTVLPPHEYWVMGDHRSISSDSRDFGPVERNLIYGRAAFIYWPADGIGVVH